jgi:Holliday junction resolvase
LSAAERNKGKRGERELARLLTLNGHPAHRGQQYSGGADSPDVICESLQFHFEVKRCERLRLHEAMNQATNDAGDMTPAVAHRRNRDEWLVTMRLSDLLELVA